MYDMKPYIGPYQSVYLSHHCTLHVQDQPPLELKTPLTLKWRRGKDMPFEMRTTVQSVVLGNKVYICRGTRSDRDAYKVMVYDIQRDTYSTLPEYNANWFAMTALNNQLVLAGGWDLASREPTNQIAVLQSDKWARPYSPMTIARHSSTAVSFNNHIIVAGGNDDQGRPVSSVEVLDVTSNRWCIADPLPVVRSSIKSVVVGDVCYIMGGFDHTYSDTKVVHRVNLRELTEKSFSMATSQVTPKPISLWHTEEDTPLFYSAPLVLKQSLLAIGGLDDRSDASTSIHLYQSSTRRWVKVGDLPTARYTLTCSVLPNGQVLIAGGRDNSYPPLSRVDLLTVTESS